jgi:hypothetical protein
MAQERYGRIAAVYVRYIRERSRTLPPPGSALEFLELPMPAIETHNFLLMALKVLLGAKILRERLAGDAHLWNQLLDRQSSQFKDFQVQNEARHHEALELGDRKVSLVLILSETNRSAHVM